jgi:hypothetical protein
LHAACPVGRKGGEKERCSTNTAEEQELCAKVTGKIYMESIMADQGLEIGTEDGKLGIITDCK